MRGITGVVLAGERPEGDPLAAEFGVAAKAAIPVGGRAMGLRVAGTLCAHPSIARVRVFGRLGALPGVSIEASAASIAATVRPLVETMSGPLLVTTADHPLLTGAMIDEFLEGARGSDLAVGLVERRVLLAAYPASRRTWLRFRGGAYSGANLFWIGSARALPLLDLWARVEQRRKRGRAIVAAFGPVLLLGALARMLTLRQAMDRVGKRFGLTARPVILGQAEACIDVDSAADHALVETILAARPA